MRCDEIKERMVDLLYSEGGTPAASTELRGHIDSCPSCKSELDRLRELQVVLRAWEEEPPLRPAIAPVVVGGRRATVRPAAWRYIRYAAAAAAFLIAFLALANAEITWNNEGFSFRTGLWRKAPPPMDYYTRAELREVLKRVLDDTESRMMETNYLMMQKVMDTLEQERWRDLRYIRKGAGQERGRN